MTSTPTNPNLPALPPTEPSHAAGAAFPWMLTIEVMCVAVAALAVTLIIRELRWRRANRGGK